MPKLDEEQLLAVSEIVSNAFVDDPIKIIAHLDATEKLDEFLKITDLKSEVRKELERNLIPTKKVLVVGSGLAKESEYRQQCKNGGISPDNFEFYLDFNDGAKIDFDKYKDNPEYGGIIVGAMPHNGVSKGNYSSVIEYIENEPGFPKVVRSNEGGELKISISGFYRAVLELLTSGALTV